MRLFLALFALLVSVAAGIVALSLLRAAAPSQLVQAEIGGAHFTFAPTLARDEETLAGGFAERLAFVATFPDFGPRPPRSAPGGRASRQGELVFVTVTPKDEALEPAERPSRLYARFLEAEAFVGPGGLVMRRFEKGSPYDLEQLYIAPPEGREFFARCPKTQDGASGAEEPCLFLFRVDGLDVELRFAPALLEQWEALTEGARGFLARIRTGGARRQ